MQFLPRVLTFLALGGLATPALAQEPGAAPDTIRVERGTVIIVDGERLRTPGDDGPVRFRFRGEDLVPFRGAPGDLIGARARRNLDREHVTMFDAPMRHVTPEIMGMEAETRRLARAVREAEGAERARLEADLRAKLNALFEAKMAARAEHIALMEAELARQQARYDARRDARDAIVDRRLRDLLGEDDVLDW